MLLLASPVHRDQVFRTIMMFQSSARATRSMASRGLPSPGPNMARSLHTSRPALVYTKPASIEGKANTVIGAGTLGRRIAMMWLSQGQPVHLL